MHIRRLFSGLGDVFFGISISLFMPNVQADVVSSGSVFPGNLGTSPTTTSQIVLGLGSVPGTLTINAKSIVNGFTEVNANSSGGIGVAAGVSGTSTGSIIVDGNGVSGSARLSSINDIQIGIGGEGVLLVQNGGVVEATGQTAFSASIITAGNSNSSGDIIVSDPGSILSSAGRIQVGAFDNSTGAMVISNGGMVQTVGAIPAQTEIEIGTGDGATGSVLVRDANSKLDVKGIIVGGGFGGSAAANFGILSIQLGGTVSTNPLASGEGGGAVSIGSSSPFGAEVFVSGAGSTLEVGAITSPSNYLTGKEVLVGGFGDGTLRVENFGQVNASGANIIVGGGVSGNDTAFPGRLTVRNGGVVIANTVTINPNAVLNGDGTITGNVILNGGTVAPGNSPGTLTIDGDFTQLGGNLVIEIGGTGAGEFDVLNVLGTAIFDPGTTIDLEFINGYAPFAGDVFDFLVANTFSSDMALVNFAVLGLDPGFQFDVDFSGTGVFSMTALNNGVSSVPVPAAVWLFSSGLLGLVSMARRRKVIV